MIISGVRCKQKSKLILKNKKTFQKNTFSLKHNFWNMFTAEDVKTADVSPHS